MKGPFKFMLNPWLPLLGWIAAGMVRAQTLLPLGTQPPGGLEPGEIPQFVFITFDDAVTPQQFENVSKISGHANPDGSGIGFTFFISLDYTDYWLVHRLHAAGHEIAVHTITHSTSTATDHTTWIREIEGAREALHRYAGVPRDEIRGFRAPYLSYNPAMFQALADLNFLYDCSVSEQAGSGGNSLSQSAYIRPYSLVNGLQQASDTGIPTTATLPSLIEVPMWKLMDGSDALLMDPLLNAGRNKEEILQMLLQNFNTLYNGNRVPLGIWLHPSWIMDPLNVEALNEFLGMVLELEDVWVVPVGSMVDWELDPLPSTHPDLPVRLARIPYDPVTEAEAFTNVFSQGRFRSVGNAAHAYPHPDTLYRAHREGPLEVTARWEFEALEWSETQYEARLYISSPEQTVDNWLLKLPLGNNVLKYGWLAVGGGLSVDQDMLVMTSNQSWDPIMGPSEKLWATLSFEGDFSELGDVEGSSQQLEAVPPRMTLERHQGGIRLTWDRNAPIFHVQGRVSLSSGDWEDIQTLFGTEEMVIPADSPFQFFRINAIP